MASEEKGEGYEFKLPDFDEDTFIHREMVSFKTTGILFVWGIVAALVSWGVFAAVHGQHDLGWGLGLLVCALMGYGLKWLFPALGADIAHFKRREWTGTGFMFFFTWLAFFILVVNPPFSDFSPPHVEVSADPPLVQAGSGPMVSVLAADNAAAPEPTIRLLRDGTDVPLPPGTTDGHGHHTFHLTNLTAGKYTVEATAADSRATTTASTTFTVAAQSPITVTLPPGGNLTDSTNVLVKVPGYSPCNEDTVRHGQTCVRTVELRKDSGAIVMEYSDSFGGWLATANFKGWTRGDNQVTATAEFLDHYQGATRLDGGVVAAAPVTVHVATEPGAHEVGGIQSDPTARPVQVPGLGLLALVGSVAVAALVARRVRRAA